VADLVIRFFVWVEGLGFSTFVRESGSVFSFPGLLFLHTLGIALVAGGATVVCFALLGLWPRTASITALERLFPVIWVGFWVEIVTGISMFMKDASSYGRNPDLYWKLLFVGIGMGLLAVLRRRVFRDPASDGRPVPAQARLMAWGVLVCWLLVIVTGRLLAYLNPLPVFF
jgi:hypothetical protein